MRSFDSKSPQMSTTVLRIFRLQQSTISWSTAGEKNSKETTQKSKYERTMNSVRKPLGIK